MKRLVSLLLVVGLSLPATLSGQEFGVAPRIGTVGVGADVALSVHPRVNVRGGVGFVPVEPEATFSDIDFTLRFPSPQFTGMLDVYPSATSGFRLSGGVLARSDDIEADGVFSGTVTVGNATYTDEEVATLEGTVETRSAAPYLGVGWGNHARTGIALVFDVGVAFQGEPTVGLTAEGAVEQDPDFQENLERERQQIEDDLGTYFELYPVLSIGLKFGLGER